MMEVLFKFDIPWTNFINSILKEQLKMATVNTLYLTPTQLTALQKYDRQEANLVRIKDANRILYEEGCVSLK